MFFAFSRLTKEVLVELRGHKNMAYLMPVKKIIVVLANSKKTGGRCLAGKELVRKGDAWEVRSWIRPVTSGKGGAVPLYLMTAGLGHVPKLLEIIEISFEKAVPTDDQPENWLLEMPVKPNLWKSIGMFELNEINKLVDKPIKLWDDDTDERRVRAGYTKTMLSPSSLYFIKPESIESVKIWSENDMYNTLKKRRRLAFRYAKIRHEFDIDDVDFAEKYYPQVPGVNHSPLYPKLENPKNTYVCVSLPPEFHGYQYKIAAAILEPPIN